MPKIKTIPELSNEIVGLNPFMDGLTIYASKKAQKVINKFGEVDSREYELEVSPYTKVFEVVGNRQQVYDLPIRCKELYLYLIHNIKTGQDYLHIDREKYMDKMGIKSVNTYKDAINGLCAALYIQPHYKIRDVYWINPYFFFKGSRIIKYHDKVVIREKP